MDARQGLRQVAIALVGDDDAAAGLGDQEIGAGDADIGGEEAVAELGARLHHDVAPLGEDAVGRQVGVHAAEIRLPILAVEVEGGGDDVRRVLLAELEDVLAEVGLDRRDAVRFQVGVDPDLLGDHRLALGDGAGAGLAADAQDHRARVLGGRAPMDRAAGALHRRGVALQVVVEVGEGVVLDVAADLAQPLELRQAGDGRGAAHQEGALGGAERLLQPGIRHGAGGVLLEGGRGDLHGGALLGSAGCPGM